MEEVKQVKERELSQPKTTKQNSEPVSKAQPKEFKSKEKLKKDRSNEDLSLSSQSKAQQTQKRQWKAPATTAVNDDYISQPVIKAFNEPIEEERKVESVPEKKTPFGGKEKKNVFNPFAKKGLGVAGDSPVASKTAEVSAGFGDRSVDKSVDKSKVSSGTGFDSKIIPVSTDLSYNQAIQKPDLNTFGDKSVNKKAKEETSGEPISDNYDEDEFDINESLPNEND